MCTAENGFVCPAGRPWKCIAVYEMPETDDEWNELAEVVSSSKFHHPHHMPVRWHKTIRNGDMRAVDAELADKTAVIARVGILTLSGGTGGWRVREAMNRIARALGVVCSADVSLLTIECTCVDHGQHETLIVTLPTTGVNTERVWRMETLMKDFENCASQLTIREMHRLMDQVEYQTRSSYSPAQVGFASALACAAFVFLLGGGPIEMLCAFVGAGVGNFTRRKLGDHRITHFACVGAAVSAACIAYLLTLLVLSFLLPNAMSHEAGYIGAMLFVIPGFPLITSGLDIAKLDFKSGIERLCYALTVILVATLFGWLVATVVHLQPDNFAPLGLSPEVTCLLRLAMSFCGVFGFSIMFNSPAKMAALAGVIGAVANTLRLEAVDLASVPPEAAALLGALVAGLLASEIRKRYTYPRISLTVPSIVIMVPGLYMYRAVYYLANYQVTNCLIWLTRASLIVTFLPIGLACARILTDRHWRYNS